MSERHTLTFTEFRQSEQKAYERLMTRKQAARRAEAAYWSDEAAAIRAGLEDIAAGRVRKITSAHDLFEGED